MSSSNFFKNNLMNLHNIVQASMLVYPKEVIIFMLRDYFSKGIYYKYSTDQFGYSNVTDHTDLLQGADLPVNTPYSTAVTNTLSPTRVHIGENYRFDVIYYPAILVKSNGGKYVPISMNRDYGSIKYTEVLYEDGYFSKIIKKPTHLITAGAWEGSITIDVVTRSLRARDDLVEDIAMCFTEINFDSLQDIGVVVKPLSYGTPSETDDRTDKLFKQSITLDIRTEWRREIPIENVIESIVFSISFANLRSSNPIDAANLTINTEVDILDYILNS